MKGKYTRESAVLLLREKQEALHLEGETRFVQRSDFSDEEVCAIKAFLGPWPRALEAAGIKPPRDGPNAQKAQKALEKRINAKRRATKEKIMRKENAVNEGSHEK